MIKRILHKAIAAVFLLAAIACQDDIATNGSSVTPDGYMALEFQVNIPDMQKVIARDVDSDGGGIQDLRLFCFGSNGAFISTSKATLEPKGDPSGINVFEGTFSATVSEYTRIIHFVANQNLNDFDETAVGGLNEKDLMDRLIASSGKMVYWQRVEGTDANDLKTEMSKGITLIRNQARIKVANPNNDYTEINGFAVSNTNAYGTVAPYNSEAKNFEWVQDVYGYISLPKGDEYADRLTPRTGVVNISDADNAIYVFETENTQQNPVSVILRDNTDLFYRVLILDSSSEFLPIRRNTSYEINIAGTLTNGVASYEAALTAPPTNNVWISIPEDIKKVSDGTHQLEVEETFVVYTTAGITQNKEITYTYFGKGSTGNYDAPVTDGDAPTVTWLTDGNAADFRADPSYDTTTGVGTISLNVHTLPEGETVRESVLSIKAGHLQRTVKIFLVRQFEFTPAWVSTQVLGDVGEPVTLMFTIPEDVPDEFFPMEVKIGADWLNVRQTTGQQLSTITPIDHPDDFGSDDWSFKFVYTATKAGVQRVYFNTVLQPETENGTYKNAEVTIEADYFTKMKREILFSTEESYRYITLSDLIAYNGSNLGTEMPNNETVYYCLVPQKVNAPVTFNIDLKDENGSAIAAGANDQFLLYAQHIDHYTDDEWTKINGNTNALMCNFTPVNETSWGSGGRVFLFEPRTGQQGKSSYTIYLRTNRPVSEEVVRIASNQPGGTDNYQGNTYRSITFELANNDPFKFYPSVKIDDEETQSWPYGPGQKVNVEFDVTSFRGTDNKSVDPFGTAFNVYIDASMLEIDETNRGKYTEDIFYEDPSRSGRFIYVVKADREANRVGTNAVSIFDKSNGSTTYPAVPETVNQEGEHKVLPFKTKSIVSEGTITISADEEVVIFDKATFPITNLLIKGEIRYGKADADWATLTPVKAGEFVTFELQNDGTRIGSMTVRTDGNYELTLRKEYKYSWEASPVEVIYRHTEDGVTTVYNAKISSLKDWYSGDKQIKLEKE